MVTLVSICFLPWANILHPSVGGLSQPPPVSTGPSSYDDDDNILGCMTSHSISRSFSSHAVWSEFAIFVKKLLNAFGIKLFQESHELIPSQSNFVHKEKLKT